MIYEARKMPRSRAFLRRRRHIILRLCAASLVAVCKFCCRSNVFNNKKVVIKCGYYSIFFCRCQENKIRREKEVSVILNKLKLNI